MILRTASNLSGTTSPSASSSVFLCTLSGTIAMKLFNHCRPKSAAPLRRLSLPYLLRDFRDEIERIKPGIQEKLLLSRFNSSRLSQKVMVWGRVLRKLWLRESVLSFLSRPTDAGSQGRSVLLRFNTVRLGIAQNCRRKQSSLNVEFVMRSSFGCSAHAFVYVVFL